MPLSTAGLYEDGYTQADLAPEPTALRGAVISQAFSDLVGPSLLRGSELSTARKYGSLAYGTLDAEQSKAFLAERGLDGMLTLEDRPYNPLELSIIANRKTEELQRQAIISRAPRTAGATLGRFGLTLATSLLDPLTVASAFVPVVGEARYARLLASAGDSALARAGVRAGVGAVEGGVGAAAVEPIIYAAKREELADYTLADSLLNIGLGTVFGGGLHAAGGAVADRLAAPRRVERLNEALATNDAKAAAPNAPAIDPAQYTRARETGGPDEYFRQATTLHTMLQDVPRVDVNDPKSVSNYLGRPVKSLSQFVRDTGGIIDDGGELAARDVYSQGKKGRGTILPGLVRKEGTPGADMDGVRQRAWEAGYFPEHAAYDDISDSELLDAIAEDANGSRRYETDAAADVQRINDAHEFAYSLKRDGIDPNMTPEQIAEHLRNLDDEARAYSTNEGPDGETLAEYDTAAELATRAGPETREAALRASVAQAVSDRPVDVDALLRRDADGVREAANVSPDARPLTDPGAVQRINEALARGETAADPFVTQQIADIEAEIRALEAEGKADGDADVFPAEIREELEAANGAVQEAALMDRAGRMLAACALRFGT